MYNQPCPDLGFYSNVEVHKSCQGMISREAREDLVFETDKKAELTAVLRDLVTRAKGGKTEREVPVLASSSAGNQPMCKALYDYDATQNDELTIKEGDSIMLLDASNPDWWFGKLNMREGMFPAAYVQKVAGGAAMKPKRANPRQNYMLNLIFADVLKATSCGSKALSNTPDTTLEFVQAVGKRNVEYKVSGGKLKVLVPPGVAGNKVRQIQANQAERAARREYLNAQLQQERQANQAARDAQRAIDRDEKLAKNKEKKKLEREKRNNAHSKQNFSKNNASPFASRMQAQAAGGASKPSWMTQKAGGAPQSSTTPVKADRRSTNWKGATKSAVSAKAKTAKPKAAPKAVKKSPWEEFVDDDSGDKYYYNNVTGQTQWEQPADFGGKTVADTTGYGMMGYQEVLDKRGNGTLDIGNLEKYLNPLEFQAQFNCSQKEFAKLPKWKADAEKRKKKLY